MIDKIGESLTSDRLRRRREQILAEEGEPDHTPHKLTPAEKCDYVSEDGRLRCILPRDHPPSDTLKDEDGKPSMMHILNLMSTADHEDLVVRQVIPYVPPVEVALNGGANGRH